MDHNQINSEEPDFENCLEELPPGLDPITEEEEEFKSTAYAGNAFAINEEK